jgi:pyruvate/2-oxoacid:ferredoxin oxidoreductase beta subunit
MGKQHINVTVLAGDGGTFDIGFQALSGAASRGENILYIVNNNGAYMNTGIQTSTATPFGATTTTNPGAGYKKTWPKDLMGIVGAHNIPYAATASLAFINDLREKMKRAKEISGFRLLMIDGPCPPGHKADPSNSITIARLAVETNIFPLFEIEHMKYKINYFANPKLPVTEYMKYQGRFKLLFKNENKNLLTDIQKHIDDYWQRLLQLEKLSYQKMENS